MSTIGMLLAFAVFCAHAEPVATVTQSAGADALTPFQLLSENDEVELGRKASATIVFHDTGRIERWAGPGTVNVGAAEGNSKRAKVELLTSDTEFGGVVSGFRRTYQFGGRLLNPTPPEPRPKPTAAE